MKKVLMTVSDEFYNLMLRSMLTPDTLLTGAEFYFDTFREETLRPGGLGEDVPVLACNAAFHRFMCGKGHTATYHIRDSDERLASELKEQKASEAKGWAFQEGAAMAFVNRGGVVVPANEAARQALREKTFPEILFGLPKESTTQNDYEEIEEALSQS